MIRLTITQEVFLPYWHRGLIGHPGAYPTGADELGASGGCDGGDVAVYSLGGRSVFVVSVWLFDVDGHMFDGNGWWMIFPMIFMVLLILMIFGLWRRGPGMWTGPTSMGDDSQGDSQRAESAVELLRRRYAGGELTDEQFDAMRRKLKDQA